MPDRRKVSRSSKKQRFSRRTDERQENESMDKSGNLIYNPEFEPIWAKNALSQSFRYVGHTSNGPYIVMECVTLLQSEDGEFNSCGVRLRIRQGNYGNLARHKEVVHRNCVVPVFPNMPANLKYESDDDLQLPFSPNVILDEPCYTIKYESEDNRSSEQVQQYFNNNSSQVQTQDAQWLSENSEECSRDEVEARRDTKQEKFDDCVVALIADGLPLHMTDWQSFKNLVHNLNTEVRLKRTKFYLQKLDSAVKDQIRPQIQRLLNDPGTGACNFSLSLRALPDGNSQLTIKSHCINSEWNYAERTLAFKRCRTKTTVLGEEFQKCLDTFSIDSEKIGLIVIDDAVKMTEAFSLSEILRNPDEIKMVNPYGSECDYDSDGSTPPSVTQVYSDECLESLSNLPWEHRAISCAHRLQSVIRDVAISDDLTHYTLGKVHRVVSFFRRSPKWSLVLKNKMKLNSNGLEISDSLFKSCKTSWSSLLSALQEMSNATTHRAMETTLFEALNNKEFDNRDEGDVHLCSSTSYTELAYMLNNLVEAVENLISKDITAHEVMLTIIKAFKDLKETSVWHFHTLKRSLLECLAAKFEPVFQMEEFVVATICDPRQKLRLFGGGVQFGDGLELRIPSKRQAEDILTKHYKFLECKLNEQLLTVNGGEVKSGLGYEMESISCNLKRKKRDIIDDIDIIAPVVNERTEPHKSEVEIYLNESCTPKNTDVLQYWKQSTIRFPVLSRIAMKFLAVPTSTAFFQRDFSSDQSSQLNITENFVLYRDFKSNE